MKFPGFLAALTLLAAAPAALADTIRVPSPGIPTIQDAVDYAWPGDVILVGPGVYDDPVTVDSKPGLEVRGIGWPVFTASADITITDTSDITLRGLDLDGPLLQMLYANDVSLVGLRFHDDASINAIESDRLLVSRCLFRDIAGPAVRIESMEDLVVERCRFEDVAGFAVGVLFLEDWADRAIFRKNRLLRTYGGFHCLGPDVLVEDNVMMGLAAAGISTDDIDGDGTRGTYRRNRIQTSGTLAIHGTGNDVVVEKNTIVGGGILLTGQGARVVGNRVIDADNEAIQTFGTALLDRNQVRGGLMGIGASGDGSTLVGNTITGTVGAGISLGALDCRISKNRVTRAGNIGIAIGGTGHLVTENRVSGSVLWDIADVSAEGVNTYMANKFGTIEFEAVY